jgi:hypothetical protein
MVEGKGFDLLSALSHEYLESAIAQNAAKRGTTRS